MQVRVPHVTRVTRLQILPAPFLTVSLKPDNPVDDVRAKLKMVKVFVTGQKFKNSVRFIALQPQYISVMGAQLSFELTVDYRSRMYERVVAEWKRRLTAVLYVLFHGNEHVYGSYIMSHIVGTHVPPFPFVHR